MKGEGSQIIFFYIFWLPTWGLYPLRTGPRTDVQDFSEMTIRYIFIILHLVMGETVLTANFIYS